jgi:hypothetical protein
MGRLVPADLCWHENGKSFLAIRELVHKRIHYMCDTGALVNESHVLRIRGIHMSKRTLAYLLLALISSSLPVSVSVARDSLPVPGLVNPVTMEGKWTTPDEWSDTQRISMHVAEGPESTGFLRIKNDDQYLHLLVDFISDTTPAIRQTRGKPVHWCYDGVSVGIDEHANEEKPKPIGDRDDFAECISRSTCLLIEVRWLSGYDAPLAVTPSSASIEGAMSYDATNDPDSQTSHAIYELAIPMQMFLSPSAIKVSVWDVSRGVNMHWPAYEGSWSTKYFGDLTFSKQQETMTHEEGNMATPMEPVMLLAIAAVVAVLVLVLLYFGRRHRVSVRSPD